MSSKTGKMVLTDDLEIHIIELKKVIAEYEKDKDNELLQWMFFLEDPNNLEVVRIMKENKEIKEAKEKLNSISEDRAIRRDILNQEIARMDREQEMYDAVNDGLERGRKEEQKDIIKNLSSMGMALSDIAKATKLTEAEVSKIIDEKN